MRQVNSNREPIKLIRTLSGHTDPVNACAISSDGSFMISAAGNRMKIYTCNECPAFDPCVLKVDSGSPLILKNCPLDMYDAKPKWVESDDFKVITKADYETVKGML